MSQNYERLKQIIDEMNTAISGMCTPPINLAGKENPSKKAKPNKNGLKEKKVQIAEENNIMEELIESLLKAGISEATVNHILDMVTEKFEEVSEEETQAPKERKNNKTKCYMRNDDPEHNKFNVKKYYNRVIHKTKGGTEYVKLKGGKHHIDKYGQIGAQLNPDLYEALSEATINHILAMVDEALEDQVVKVHGPASKGYYRPEDKNKTDLMLDKVRNAKGTEIHQATMRKAGVKETDPKKWTGKDRNDLQDAYDQIEDNRTQTKNTKGEKKTSQRQHVTPRQWEEHRKAWERKLFDRKNK